MRPLIYPSNPLAFPGGAPGFDPTHPMAHGIVPGHGFSGVAQGANFIDLLSGQVGAPTLTSAKNYGPIGPSVLLNSSTSTVAFSGQPLATDTLVTIGTIAIISSVSGKQVFFCATGPTVQTGQWLLAHDATGGNGVYVAAIGSADINSGINLSSSVPYFIAASANLSGVANFVVVNLATGAIRFSSVAGSTQSGGVGTGTYYIGAYQATGYELGGYEASIMYAPVFHCPADLGQWAQRPWGFWYPPTAAQLLFMPLRAPLLTKRGFVQGRILA
jgi:hypothetical protein